ncbi:hypothetical protein PCYB_094150 [Plasmodium cynomolgi strain B]|uniref:Condensin-2 complex subunit D3 n=1 Tax=Plasmodium cynomolgi (strain B) TaxID=1120755 RepID=K6UDH9_PLACD|nr:hypothetical protein PCYB_094150 [Plasmodium cynomolgi strain B]GAB66631.1 hypothetical protein PCYB_094150 [Plasmodium cynomolgi strain B]
MEKGGKRKMKVDGVGKDDHEGNEKKKKVKVEAKPTNDKIHSCLNIHNNVLIKMVNENKRKFEKVDNVETMYRKIKASITSLNVSSVLMEHYDSFIYYEKNKIDFLLPELDGIVNSSNIDVLKGLSELSFYPIYHETLRKRVIEWLAKDRGKKQTNKEDTEDMSMSYWFSLNLLLTYLIYKNDEYSSYASLVHLNLLQWMQRDKRRLHFRLFTLKGILKRFLTCSFYFNDKEMTKLKKVDSEDAKNENEWTVLKNIFMALHESIEYLDVSNLVNINDKNCIFELIKFFLELVKKPLIHSIHILCINYLIKIVRRCYDLRLSYNINVELYDIGPEVNIFVKIVNLIFAKILILLKETRIEESTHCVDQINNMNSLIILFFTNVVNNCIRVIVPQVLFNEKLKRDYLSAREGTSAVESQVCFEDQYQIRSIILDLFLDLMKKKKTNKNESIFLKLFKLFLERLEDPNTVVKAKALSILGILTNRKYHDNNSLVYKFIFNKTKEKINMYKIISGNIFSHKTNIRKLTVQYIEAIFETLIGKKLSYKLFLIFISNYMYCLSLDAMSSVRRQVLLTVNNFFINASEDVYVAKMWLSVILAAITDIEETIKDEAISLFLNTFIKSAFQCPILKATEKRIKETYFGEEVTNYFLTLLKTMTKYDLQNINLIIFCLKRKKNNNLEEFISLLNSFMYNLRYFSINMWNIFLLDFVIELSKEYRHSVDIENVLFLLSRCYRVYLLSAPGGGPIHMDSVHGGDAGDGVHRGDGADGVHGNEADGANAGGGRPTEEPTDHILTREDLLDEVNSCSKGVLKNIMLKLFTIVYNLLDTIEELNEDFMKNLEYAIFHFNCPLCLIYIILNILIKKKKIT